MVRNVCLACYWLNCGIVIVLDGKASTDGFLKALGMFIVFAKGSARVDYDDRFDATNGE